MNNYEYEYYDEMGSFCKSLNIKKTNAYAFNNVLQNWSVTKVGLRSFLC